MKSSTATLVAIATIIGVALAIPAPHDAIVPEDTLVASKLKFDFKCDDPETQCCTDGNECVFPYTWQGQEYNECIETDWYAPWCATAANAWTHYAHCSPGCEAVPEKTAEDTGPEPDGSTAPAPPAEPEDPDCEEACCQIDIYKKKDPKKKTLLGKKKSPVKTIKKCSYTGGHPYVRYTGKIKSFVLSGDCEKVTLYDDDYKNNLATINDATFTSSQDELVWDLRNDIKGLELFITNKNQGACKLPDASNVGPATSRKGKSKGRRLM